MMNRLIVVACCMFVLAPAGAWAEVYKWKDATGKTHYSDMPPMSNIPYTTLSGKKPASAPGKAAADKNAPEGGKPKSDASGKPAGPTANIPPAVDNAARPEEGKPAADAKGADAAAQKKALEEKAAREAEAKRLQEERLAAEKRVKDQNCKNARSRVAQFQQGGRMYRTNERGEREYYGDKEIANELAQAKEDVEANCE